MIDSIELPRSSQPALDAAFDFALIPITASCSSAAAKCISRFAEDPSPLAVVQGRPNLRRSRAPDAVLCDRPLEGNPGSWALQRQAWEQHLLTRRFKR